MRPVTLAMVSAIAVIAAAQQPAHRDPGRPAAEEAARAERGPVDRRIPTPGTLAPVTERSALPAAAAAPPASNAGPAPARLAAAAAACREIRSPRPIGDDLLPSLEPLGPIETTKVDGFTDDYLYSPTGESKIGTRREWGSTIVFFGFSGPEPGFNGTNAIDANDPGREVQAALYDAARLRQGCAWNASCLSRPEDGCGAEITYLGWNPVQGGNECRHGSETVSVLHEPGRLESTVTPRFWNPDWSAPDCRNRPCPSQPQAESLADVRYRQRLRFVDPQVVEMWMEYTNLSAIDHPPTVQEFPTLYGSFGKAGPDLRVVLDSEGNRILVDQPANDGFLTRAFLSVGGFVALQNRELEYGVGLFHENRQWSYQAWQRVGLFNNVRARFKFGLPAHGTVRGRAYLILGGFEAIREAAARLDARLPPFGELESPWPDEVVGDRLRVAGWVLDNREVVSLELLINGQPVASTTPSEARPDVCALWPGYSTCDEVGYELSLDLTGVPRCPHLLAMRAIDSDGNSRVIDRRRFYVGEAPDCDGGRCDPQPATHPVYRFYWSQLGDADHSFSRSDQPPPDYAAEGVAFRAFSRSGDGLLALWQTYCAVCTDHLQSTDPHEAEEEYANAVLLGYCSRKPSQTAPRELRRLWSSAASDHYVSADPLEWQRAATQGYAFEGSCWVP